MREGSAGRRPAGHTARAAWLAGAAAFLLAAPGCSGRTAPAAPAAAPVTAATALQFIADDFPRAQEDAKRRSVPIFVEAWAPW
jgi:hypothetical protein